MQEKKAENSPTNKHYKRKEDKNWYQSLLLSQKFKINVILGLTLTALGAVILTITGPEMLHHWQFALHGFIGIAVLLVGLWFFGRGLRYEFQLDAIRIAKRNRNFNGGNQRKGPKKPAPKKA